uniref:Uncharacterized protein n=1 Tax=Anguilla anguilla TaxID=7936 RepID=A0A0E9WFE2_ANGAN
MPHRSASDGTRRRVRTDQKCALNRKNNTATLFCMGGEIAVVVCALNGAREKFDLFVCFSSRQQAGGPCWTQTWQVTGASCPVNHTEQLAKDTGSICYKPFLLSSFLNSIEIKGL